ncbi:MAG: hypothetical protein QF632_03695 [Candidatus Woesearchaeota archaeon]|mgnify:CR=1 FL=1|jgi:hypothetical protein|nr:hypothetical protein [Candidatus Woesearchaeota archaeon]
MAFDPNLNKEIFKETAIFETTRIHVGIYSYNEGEKKLQLSRENMNQNGEWSFAKLGRMIKEEVESVLPLMKKALESL